MNLGAVTKCRNCPDGVVGVIDTRDHPLGRRRRRMCRTCGYRWTTIEVDWPTMEALRPAMIDAALAETTLKPTSPHDGGTQKDAP